MGIDLLAIEPSTISRDLSGYITLLYSQPKVGKTTLVRDAGALILGFEAGTRALSGAMVQPVKSWAEMKTVYRELKKPKVKERYKVVAVDTVDRASLMCEKYLCNKLEVDSLGDLGYGKGYAAYRKEMDEIFNGLALEGYSVFFITHDKQIQIERPDGSEYTKTVPSVSSSVRAIIENMADIIVYGYIDHRDGERYMQLRSDDNTVVCGGRFKYFQKRIPFGYQSLVDELNRAIDEEEEKDGAVVVEERSAFHADVEYDYGTEMARCETAIANLQEKAGDEDTFKQTIAPKIKMITDKYLGRDKKLSKTSPEQAEQVFLVAEELEELLG